MHIAKFIRYLLSNTLSKGLSIILVSLVSFKISPEEWAIYQYYYFAVVLIIPILFISIWEGIFKQLRANNEKVSSAISSCNLIFLVMLFFWIFLFLLLSFFLRQSIPFFITTVILGVSHCILLFVHFYSRGVGRSEVYSQSLYLSSAVNLLIVYISLYLYEGDISDLFNAQIIANFAGALFIFQRIKGKVVFEYAGVKSISSICAYSLPLCLNVTAWWMIGVGPMFAMSAAGLDNAEVGVFSVALRLGALVSLVSVVFNMVWQEKRFSESNETGTSSFISSLHPVFMVAVASVFVGSLVALIYYSFFVSIDFNKGLSIVPLILISSALLMVSNHFGSELLANNSSFNVAASSIIGGFLAMLSSYALTASCGMSAGALGSILGALIMILIRVKSLSIWSVFLSLVRKNIISIILLLGYTLFVSKNGFDLYNSILAIFATLFLTYNLLVFKKNTNI